MSNATELLRRALEAYDHKEEPYFERLHHAFEDIRAYLAAEPEVEPFADSIPKGVLKWNPEAEPTKIEIEAERQDIDWQSNEGAVYLFAGWLTTRDKVISCGRTENAAPMAEAIKEYKAEWPKRFTKPAEKEAEPVFIRPDHLALARKSPFLCQVGPVQVADFIPIYTRPEPARKPMTEEELENLFKECHGNFEKVVQAIEKHHGIGGDDGQ